MERRASRTWRELVNALKKRVPAGRVTTYSQVSVWGYGDANRNQPVRSALVGARNDGHQELTNRVVKTDGSLADLPAGADQQRAQLKAEGVPFTPAGRVDLKRSPPVPLG